MVRRGHEPALLPRNGAGESFVSFIALFGGGALLSGCSPYNDGPDHDCRNRTS
jgi:hypothetical protein